MTSRLPPTADVLVIGGGIMGASIAYNLALRGEEPVVLEKGEFFGLGSTGLNAGGVRHQFSTAVNIELSKLSIEMMEHFADTMHQEVSLKRCGYLFLLDNERDLDQFRANVAPQNALGVPSRVVSVDEIARLAPEVSTEGLVGGTWCDRDGLVDPNGVLQGFVSGARRLGAKLFTDAPVSSIAELSGGWRVTTPQGSIDAEQLVIACGPWSGEVGKMAGVDLPIVPIKRQIAVTAPIAELSPNFPFVIDFARALYAHREGQGVLTGMSNRDQPPGFDTSVDGAWRDEHVAAAIERSPFLGDAEISAEWAGLYEVTPDDQPIIGKIDGKDGLYACAGFSGHGLMHGPIAGLLMAEEILDERAHTVDIAPLRGDRFTAGVPKGEYNVV